jgi:small conductance mechanosensitive channel
MQLVRLAESTALNNAWIVGILATAALIATWLIVALSSYLLRKVGASLRLPGIQPIADAYSRRARLIGVIASFAVMLAGAGVLAYTLWRDRDLELDANEALAQITVDSLLTAARSVALIIVFLLAFYALRVLSRRLIARARRRISPRDLLDRQRIFLERFFIHLPAVINLALAYALLSLASGTFHVPSVLEWLLLTTVYVLLVLSSGRALIMLAHYLSERLLDTWEQKSKGTKLEEYYAALRRLLPVVQRSIEAIVYVLMATVLVRRFEALEPFAPYGPLLIRIISMFLAASVVVEVARVLVARLLLAAPSAADDTQRRRQTFVGLIQSIIKYIIYFIVCMMILEDLGIDPTPILAGAGIVGLTVGLGSQKIVADLLNGLFLLFEDQILQGDYIKIGDTEGMVEQISLRLTRIRDRFGRLHIMRNGEIQNVINYSRGWTLTVVEMGVSYEDNLPKALRVIGEVTGRLPALMPGAVLEPPIVKGIETIGDTSLVVRIETKVAPGTHFDVKRALHRLLVDGFNANGLEIPYPKSVQFGIEGVPPAAPDAPPAAAPPAPAAAPPAPATPPLAGP